MFTMELGFKVFALGWREYISSKFNRLDCIVVVAGLFEFTLVHTVNMSPIGLSVWRCLRLIRLFRYTSYWEGMNDLANALMDSIAAIVSLVGLLGIFMFIFALMGMQFFGGKFNFEDGWGSDANPRSNFNSFAGAFFTMFQVIGIFWAATIDHTHTHQPPTLFLTHHCNRIIPARATGRRAVSCTMLTLSCFLMITRPPDRRS